jgi:hypothetical protein
MEYTVPAPCPICGREIDMAMEEMDDGHPDWPGYFWQAVGIAPDNGDEEPHTCVLTDAQIDRMAERASKRAQTDPYYRHTAWDD